MNLGERRPNKWWTETDTFAMLTLIEQLDLVHELDKKRQRNDSHFRRLRHSLAKRHIHFTVNQIRNRWKSLKHKYRKIKTASYRSPAARLSAMESFRYFRMLDRMLAHKPRVGAPEEASTVGHDLVLTPSDLEDHTDSTGDVAQACAAAAPWHDPLIPKLESGEEVKPDPDEPPSLDQADWAVNGTDEVMTLGLSGEYLGAVKAEPIPSSALHSLEGAREPTSCSSEEFQGTCEDTSSLILQQLTILNHQLSEQLAEQRAFHCSMLGMMDRQIEVLEQLSSVTRSQQEAKAASASATASATVTPAAANASPSDVSDECLSRRVHEVLLRMQRRDAEQVLSPAPPPPSSSSCLSRPFPSAEPEPEPAPAPTPTPMPPSWAVSLLETSIKQEPSPDPADTDTAADSGAAGAQGEEAEALAASADVDTPGRAEDSQPERQPSSPRKGALVNGLLDSCPDQ